MTAKTGENCYLTFKELCEELSISPATGKIWLKLNKITPDKIQKKDEIFFLKSNVKSLKDSIITGSNPALKSRRNKNFISGNSIYKSYISQNSKNISKIQELLKLLALNSLSLSEDFIKLFIAECALQMYFQRKKSFSINTQLLYKYLTGTLNNTKEIKPFIEPFITNFQKAQDFITKNSSLFDIKYYYEFGEDVLGLLYISLKNIKNRKAKGAYYTPQKTVKKLLEQLFNSTNNVTGKILDPCCGTGNFLLQLPQNISFNNIYANDIDPISAQITRINLALHFEIYDYQKICKHISCSDYLKSPVITNFDYIIGNPPWGYKFSKEEQNYLKKHFKTAQCKNIESYDVVIEQALNNLKKNGILSFVVPESVLNVKSHKTIRKILNESTRFQFLEYLGNVFDSVQCPAIIMQLKNTGKKMSTLGMKIKDLDREFSINSNRVLSCDNFMIKSNDEEYLLLSKLLNMPNCTTLKNQAIFALGIVTGNNSKYIETAKNSKNELILKGSDIDKYIINPASNYISSDLKQFQQAAPVEIYKAKEKLVYRFICKQPVFAYDNKQTLTLNSCNILIPQINGLNIKYVLAILNSKISRFIYSKQFNSIKILRHYLESLPIPIPSKSVQEKIIELADKIINEPSKTIRKDLCFQIDEILFNIFELSDKEREIIVQQTN